MTLVEAPLSGFSSPLPPRPLPPCPPHLGSKNEAGGRESIERVGAAGSSLADRSRLHGSRSGGLLHHTGATLPAPWAGGGPRAPRG